MKLIVGPVLHHIYLGWTISLDLFMRQVFILWVNGLCFRLGQIITSAIGLGHLASGLVLIYWPTRPYTSGLYLYWPKGLCTIRSCYKSRLFTSGYQKHKSLFLMLYFWVQYVFRLVLSNAVSYFPLQRLTVYQVLMKNGLCLYQHQVQRYRI